MKALNISELEKVQESKRISAIIREVIRILLASMNDWPTPIYKLEDYELEVNSFIRGEATKDKINLALAQIDFSKNSWQSESLSQLVHVFQFYHENISLKDIIADLSKELEVEKTK